jgi:hypothetical protein
MAADVRAQVSRTGRLALAVTRSAAKGLHSGVIDIRGAAAGVAQIDVFTSGSVTPSISSHYTAAVPAQEPNLNCSWALQVVTAPPAYPTLKVGETATLRMVASNCGVDPNLPPTVPFTSTYHVKSVTATLVPAAPTPPVSVVSDDDVAQPTIVITADAVGTTTVTFLLLYDKQGPRSIDGWGKSLTFAGIAITVVP